MGFFDKKQPSARPAFTHAAQGKPSAPPPQQAASGGREAPAPRLEMKGPMGDAVRRANAAPQSAPQAPAQPLPDRATRQQQFNSLAAKNLQTKPAPAAQQDAGKSQQKQKTENDRG